MKEGLDQGATADAAQPSGHPGISFLSRLYARLFGSPTLFHRHDYNMEFIGDGLHYRLVCSCGDVAPDMETALRRMRSRTKTAR